MMESSLTIEAIPFGSALHKLRGEWDALLEKSTRPSIYADFDYLYLSVEHFGHNPKETFFVVMRDSNCQAIRAVFPMSLGHRECFKKEVRVLEHCCTTFFSDIDKPYPIIDANYEEKCWTRFQQYLDVEYTNWDWLEYCELIPESKFNELASGLFKKPKYYPRQIAGPASPIVDLSGSWEEFIKKHKNLRKKIQRAKKQLGDSYSYKVYNKAEDIQKALKEYIATEMAGWKSGKGISDEEAQEFYSELLALYADKGLVYIGILYDEQTPVSTELTFVFGETVYFAHGTYHPDYSHLSPGTVSTGNFIEYFHGKNYKDGDFLAGFANYVNPLASKVDTTKHTTIYRVNGMFFYFVYKRIVEKINSKLKSIFKKTTNNES